MHSSQTETIRNSFFQSIKLGTGEAYLLMKEHRYVDFSDLLIEGAVTNFAYDRQSEGNRAEYIYKLFRLTRQKEKIVVEVLTRLRSEKDDYYGLDQMCDLAVKFFKTGYPDAKLALNERFEKNITKGYEFCGQRQLVNLEGMKGLLKVAALVGKILTEDTEDSESSVLADSFQKRNKAIDVYEELRLAAQKNRYIKAYYRSILEVKATEKKSRRKRIKKFSLEIVREAMEKERFGYLSSKRNNELTKEEVEELANEFLHEKDRKRKEMYLRFFSSRKFPFDYEPILSIARRRNPPKTRIVEYAIESLKHFHSKEIRQFCLEGLTQGKKPEHYLCLLEKNYKRGDHKILTELIDRSEDDDFIHSVAVGIIRIYKANPLKECRSPLELIYDKMNCGMHRVGLVEVMADNGVLAERISREIGFDSYKGVRKLSRRLKRG